MQEQEPYVSLYRNIGAAAVPYGDQVVEMHASRAVRRYKPDVVIGCWVTHTAGSFPAGGGRQRDRHRRRRHPAQLQAVRRRWS